MNLIQNICSRNINRIVMNLIQNICSRNFTIKIGKEALLADIYNVYKDYGEIEEEIKQKKRQSQTKPKKQ
jgi:hypothetical protein